MNIEDYKSNSHRSKAEGVTRPAATKPTATTEKKIKKVALSAPVTSKKKSEARKFFDNFISEDVANVKDYLVKDVLIPTVKDTIWAAITNSIEMVLWGSTGHSRRPGGGSRPSSSYVSYSSYSSSRPSSNYRDRRYEEEETPRSRFDPEDITFRTLGDAEAVLNQMAEVIEAYDRVTINDLYDMVDRTPPPYTATSYGWTYLDGSCKPVRVNGGYILKLPKARPV